MEEASASRKLLQRKRRIKRHLIKMKSSLIGVLEYAFDRYYEEQALSYLKVEETLYRFEDLISQLLDELESTSSMESLHQLAGRANYVADQLDVIEARVYKRSRRRGQRPVNLAGFFDTISDQAGGQASDSKQEISSLSEAYSALELEEGCSLTQVMSSFRRLAKKYHPDARGGDRSNESALHRVFEAYQVLKESLAE